MKTTLTIEESARLIELGVDAKLASEVIIDYIDPYDIDDAIERKRPIFILTDILSILPKEIDDYHLVIEESLQGYDVTYELWDSFEDRTFYMGAIPCQKELIDALNSLLIWAITNGHVKTEKK